MPNFKIIGLPVLEKKTFKVISSVEDFFKIFTIYGRGGHLGHVTGTIYINFRPTFQGRLHMKFGFGWQSGFGREDV